MQKEKSLDTDIHKQGTAANSEKKWRDAGKTTCK